MKSTLKMKPAKAKKISVRRTGDVRLTTAAMCSPCYWTQV